MPPLTLVNTWLSPGRPARVRGLRPADDYNVKLSKMMRLGARLCPGTRGPQGAGCLGKARDLHQTPRPDVRPSGAIGLPTHPSARVARRDGANNRRRGPHVGAGLRLPRCGGLQGGLSGLESQSSGRAGAPARPSVRHLALALPTAVSPAGAGGKLRPKRLLTRAPSPEFLLSGIAGGCKKLG